MTIERRFEPDPEALERLVEILYRLFVEESESNETVPAKAQPSTCVSEDQE